MLRYAQTLWHSFFPHEPVFPLLIVGYPLTPVENIEDLETHLKHGFSLFTYREGFEGINAVTSIITTDQGWGCLLRATQMLLAHFLRTYAPDDYRLQYFHDRSGGDAIFSVHNMIANVWDRKAFRAQYWSPSQGCEALRLLISKAVATQKLHTRIAVVCSTNGCIFAEDVAQALKGGAEVVLVLAAVRVSVAPRLGQESYLQLEGLMSQPACVGIVGGVPGRSYYFFGHSQSQLLYLDPHQHIQPALVSDAEGSTGLVQPTIKDVRCVHWSYVDTSLFIAFAVRTKTEWEDLRAHLPTRFLVLAEGRGASDYELQRHQKKPNAFRSLLHPMSEGTVKGVAGDRVGSNACTRLGADESDSWELL